MLKALRIWLLAAATLLVPSHVVVATLVMQSGARLTVAEAPDEAIFPLAVSSNGRHLEDAQGQPRFVHGDTAWSAIVQLTNAEITTYLEDRASRGVNAVIVNLIERGFSSQTPRYENVDGDPPFTTMADFAGFNSNYWARSDHFIATAYALGIAVWANPAYIGFAGLDEGWDDEILAASNQEMFDYGEALATRYAAYPNIIWTMGGDADPDATLEARQYQIALGILSVDPDALITGHGAPGSPAYATWNGQTGFNVNTAYAGDVADVYSEVLTEYARDPALPVVSYEGIYEQERASPISAAGLRRQSYQAVTSGAAGQFFGNSPIWHFESPNAPFSYTGTWESNLNSTGSQQQVFVKDLIDLYSWHLLEPVTDTSLVSSSLSSGTNRICPALASDGTFAWIWVPSSQTITVNTNALTGVGGNVRIRRYNVTTGAFTTIDASVSKTSADSVATGGEGVIVIDAASVMFGADYLQQVANDEVYALAA